MVNWGYSCLMGFCRTPPPYYTCRILLLSIRRSCRTGSECTWEEEEEEEVVVVVRGANMGRRRT